MKWVNALLKFWEKYLWHSPAVLVTLQKVDLIFIDVSTFYDIFINQNNFLKQRPTSAKSTI